MGFKQVPLSKLKKRSASQLEKRRLSLAKALTKQRKKDLKAKGRHYYSPEWRRLLDENEKVLKALQSKNR